MVAKTCSMCSQTYPLENFYKNSSGFGGVGSQCKACAKEYSKTHRKEHHFKYYAAKFKTTPEIVQTVLSRVVCDICGAPPRADKRNFIDHCHKTGAIRGLLCDDCNMGLGRFKDSPERLEKAIEYLKQNGVER